MTTAEISTAETVTLEARAYALLHLDTIDLSQDEIAAASDELEAVADELFERKRAARRVVA